MLHAWVQVREDGMPFNVNAYAAYDGFHERGILTDFFDPTDDGWWAALPDRARQEELVFSAGIGVVTRILRTLGIPPNSTIDYPRSLEPWFGRKVWQTTLGDVRDSEKTLFVKSVDGKLINGHLVGDFSDLLKSTGHPDATPVYVSEPMEFKAEWRVFILDGEILDIRRYKGSPFLAPSEDTVLAMAEAVWRSGECPAAFGMDVGWVEGGRTCLVEVNEGYSLGTYGLAPALVARMLERRWRQFFAHR